jgi:hypothetical protein
MTGAKYCFTATGVFTARTPVTSASKSLCYSLTFAADFPLSNTPLHPVREGLDTMALCKLCGSPSELRCNGCHEIHYCGQACQKKDWSVHKHLCKTFKDFLDRPAAEADDENFSRAILFHPDEDGPRFIWLKQIMEYHGYLSPSINHLLANNEEEARSDRFISSETAYIDKDTITGLPLSYCLQLTCRESFYYDGSTPNKAINKVSHRASPYLHDWKGPLIACGYEHSDRDHTVTVDLVPSDLRYIVNFFNTYMRGRTRRPMVVSSVALGNLFSNLSMGETTHAGGNENTGAQAIDTVMGVRINCNGDVKVEKRPRFESVKIPITHGIFRRQPTPVSSRIELPICVAKVPGTDKHWESQSALGEEGFGLGGSTAATFLHIGCEPNVNDFPQGYGWGLAPVAWNSPVGTAVVLRKDKKPILPEHVAALAEWCEFELIPAFIAQVERGLEKDFVLDMITMAKFKAYYGVWKARQPDGASRNQVCPYDV